MADYSFEDWQRLGEAVRKARRLAGRRNTNEWAAHVGRSSRVLLGLERGEPQGDDTLELVERALGWVSGSADRVLSGQAPVPEVADVPVQTTNGEMTVTIATLGLADPELRKQALAVAKAAGWEITGGES